MRVLVSGGGTGGHIYPAVSLINEIKKQNPEAKFLYVGTERGLESKIVPESGIPFKTIRIQGFRRSLSIENIKTIYLFAKSIQDSKKIIREFKPDVVIGTGGYVCGAVVYAATRLGIPTVIHEQNSVPGATNKFLAKYVDKIGICFTEAAAYFPTEKVVLTGNPRAQEVVQLETTNVLPRYELNPQKETVLVFGGSQGALTMMKAMGSILTELNQREYQVLFATGPRYYEEMVAKLTAFNYKPQSLVVVPYIDDMVEVLNSVNLVVSRAGATTLAEVTALGVPSILIPSPNVTNDHQTKNATSLVRVGAAELIADQGLTGDNLLAMIDELMTDNKRREKMAQAAKGEGIPDATDRLYELVQSILKKD